MEIAITVIVLLFIFVAVATSEIGPKFLQLHHEWKMRKLETEESATEQVARLESERDELEARLAYLEDIVCDVDYELNAKLNAIASQQLRLPEPSALTNNLPQGDPGEPGEDEVEAKQEDSLATADTAPITRAFFSGELQTGQEINERFVIEEPLGEGGLGTVYRAYDKTLDEQVALKVLRDLTLETDPNARERFRREVLAARKISHPNVVRLHDLYDVDGVDFVAMEYVDGESLREILEQNRHLSPGFVRRLGMEVLQALQACHDAGVVHRDVKPDNLLVTDDGTTKLIDFGIAKFGTGDEKLTATQKVLGTPAYMSPEQLCGEPVDLRSDLYSFAAVLFELLTGRPPFVGPTPISIAFAHCRNEPSPPSDHRPELSSDWDDLVLKALSKERATRFSSAEQMRAALSDLQAQTTEKEPAAAL